MGLLGFHGVDEFVGFVDGFLHVGDEFVDVTLEGDFGAFEAGDGLGVEVVLEEEDLVVEGGQDGFHFGFGGTHGGQELVVAGPGGLELGGGFGFQVGALILGEFVVPFLEEGLGDGIHGLNLAGHGIGAFLADVILGGKLVVLGFQVAAVEAGDAFEFVEGGLELLFGGFLAVAGLADAFDEDVAFVVAEFFPHVVVGALAAGEGEECCRQERGGDETGGGELTHGTPRENKGMIAGGGKCVVGGAGTQGGAGLGGQFVVSRFQHQDMETPRTPRGRSVGEDMRSPSCRRRILWVGVVRERRIFRGWSPLSRLG